MSLMSTWSEISEWLGGTSGQFLNDLSQKSAIANGALGVVCNIANYHPGNYQRMNSLTRSFVDNACHEGQLGGFNDYTPPPFPGGQCAGVQYEVLLEATTQFNGDGRANQTSRHVVYGTIDDIKVERPTPVNDPRIIAFSVYAHDINGNEKYYGKPIGGVGWTAQLVDIEIIRMDGEEDNCGNVDGTGFPPPQDLSEEVRSFDTTFHETNNTFIQENYPEGDTINFYGDDYNVEIDHEGIHIIPKEDIEDDPGNNEPVQCVITEPVECIHKPPEGEPAVNVQEEYEPELDGTEEEEKEEEEQEATNVTYVLVTVTTPPEYRKTILRPDPQDNTFYAGWFRWIVDIEGTKYSLPEMPINKPSIIFRRPDEATGYRLHTTNEAKVKTTKLVKKIEPENET